MAKFKYYDGTNWVELLPTTGGTLTGLLSIAPTNIAGNYDEGIRLHPHSGWSTIMFCASENSGNTGTSANSWSIHNNEGTFGVYKNASNISSASTGFTNSNGSWTFKGQTDIVITSSDTALNLHSSTANSYLGFYNGNGNALGWLGVNGSNQPIFNVSGADYLIALNNDLRKINSTYYERLGSCYDGGNNHGFVRITIPTNPSWGMVLLECSVRQSYSTPRFGKLLIYCNIYSNSVNVLNAYTDGCLSLNVKGYVDTTANKSYIYITDMGSWSGLSLDRMVLGDAITGTDFTNNIVVEFVDELPASGVVTANMFNNATTADLTNSLSSALSGYMTLSGNSTKNGYLNIEYSSTPGSMPALSINYDNNNGGANLGDNGLNMIKFGNIDNYIGQIPANKSHLGVSTFGLHTDSSHGFEFITSGWTWVATLSPSGVFNAKSGLQVNGTNVCLTNDSRLSDARTANGGTADNIWCMGYSPNNAYVGGKLSAFYSWGQGSPSGSYCTGLTVGGHPQDQNYGFQLAQPLWDDNLYVRRYDSANISGSWGSWNRLLTNSSGLSRDDWWNSSDSHSANDLGSGIVFAYTSHGTPATGTLVSFAGVGSSCEAYRLQLQGNYYSNQLFYRNRNGDNGTWNNWVELITTANISSQSVNYASSAGSAGNADTVDSKHSIDFVNYLGDLQALGGGTPASDVQTYWSNNIGNNRIDMAYNDAGAEYSVLFSKAPSGLYGSVLKWGYTDRYLRILRHYSGNWATNDWEKVDAGYADSAGAVAWANVSGKPSFSTVATSGSYNDLSDKPTIPTVPTNISSFTNDVGYITSSGSCASATSAGSATVADNVSYIDARSNASNLPSSANTSGQLRFVLCALEPTTKYDGYVYLILS